MPATATVPISIPHEGTDRDETVGDSESFSVVPHMNQAVGSPERDPPQGHNVKSSSSPPVPELDGEEFGEPLKTATGDLYMTQYRILIVNNARNAIANIPLVAVDSIESGDGFVLHINCKYGRVFKVPAKNREEACELFKKLTQKTVAQRKIEDVFAWQFAKAAKKVAKEGDHPWLKFEASQGDLASSGDEEFKRLGFSEDDWEVSDANDKFELCETYPKRLIVPKGFSKEELQSASVGRFNGRFPVAVWRCKDKGSVLLRSSQPRVGLFSYRYLQDEQILERVRNANRDPKSTLLIIDARSYTVAFANRAKGGGFESAEYYQQTEVQFMGLPNIHNIRYSFHQLRSLLAGPRDQATFLQSLQTTQWLHYLSNLIDSAQRCVDALFDGRSVLVHCSDGWDRTTQIVSLAKLIADPFYRTIKGFENLIRREWIYFGHKFGDRTGVKNADANERSPVFLQWLDCVYQLHQQFPIDFQFTTLYLMKLAQHCYSGLFGTFLWNSLQEKNRSAEEGEETLSVWSYLNDKNPQFVNVVYEERRKNGRLRPSVGVEDMVLWKQLYFGPQLEQLINAPEEAQNVSSAGMAGSQHSEADRCSLKRTYSTGSMNNTDVMNQSVTGSSYGSNHVHAACNQNLLSNEHDLRSDSMDTPIASTNKSHRQQFAREVDDDGLTKAQDIFQEKVRQHFLEDEKEIERLRLENQQMKEEQGRSAGNYVSDVPPQNGYRLFGDESSDGGPRSSNSTVSSEFSAVDNLEASNIPDGPKGFQMDDASPQCTGCKITFSSTVRRHHCRSCGMLFCDKCTSHRYYRVQGSKGEQVRSCSGCYEKMCTYTGSSVSTLQPTQQSHAPTHKSGPSPIVIGPADGQKVCG